MRALKLPQTWTQVHLEIVAEKITKGSTPTTYGYEFESQGINFIKIENVINGRIDVNTITDFISEEANSNQKRSQLNIDDILFSIAGTIGETAIVEINHLPANTNQAFAIISGFSAFLIPKFLEYQLKSFVTTATKSRARGGAMNNVSLGDLKQLNIVLPPPNEQKRIVAKIEELFSELDKGIESLKTAREQLKVYRQAILKHAFEGKLTAKWREKNKDKLETAEYYDDKALIEPELQKALPTLPGTWKWRNFEQIAEVASSLTDPRLQPNFPHIAPDNIEKETGRLLDCRTVSEDKVFSPKHKFTKGQIIYSKIRPYLSKLIIAPFDGLCSADMYPLNTVLNTHYLYYFMMTSFFVNKASTSGSRTILPKINKKELSKIPVPTCGMKEQEIIASEIQQALSLIGRLEEDIVYHLSKAEVLSQSILKQAFSGRLVAQDPNDEPASVLLERIKAEKNGSQKRKKNVA